jgi:hypothetical protein
MFCLRIEFRDAPVLINGVKAFANSFENGLQVSLEMGGGRDRIVRKLLAVVHRFSGELAMADDSIVARLSVKVAAIGKSFTRQPRALGQHGPS